MRDRKPEPPKGFKQEEPAMTFDSNEELAIAREELQAMKNTPGWRRVARFLSGKAKFYQAQLNGDQSGCDDMEDIKRTRKLRNIALQIMNLPDILVEQERLSSGEDIRIDPFATAEDLV